MIQNLHRTDGRVNRFGEYHSVALRTLFRRTTDRDVARDLYGAIVNQARQPGFYAEMGVPDTVDGRFEMICLHAFLVLRRLRADKSDSALSQALFDTMFEDMDRNLREMGAGDLGVGRRVKAMAKALYGRIAAYDAGLDADRAKLVEALLRNAYGTVEPTPDQASRLAEYMLRENDSLRTAGPSELRAGRVAFGPAGAAAAGDRQQ